MGAVATQSVVEPAYGPRGLALMRDGTSAPAALHQLLADDAQEPARQVAMIDRGGRVAVHTGARCIRARRARRGRPGERPGEHHGARHGAGRDGARLLGRIRRRPCGAAARRARRRRGRGRRPARAPVRRAGHRRSAGDRQPGGGPPGGPARGGPRRPGARAPPAREPRPRVRARRRRRPAGRRRRRGGARWRSTRPRTARSRTTSSSPSGTAWRWRRTAARTRPRPILQRAFEAHPGWIELLKRLPAAGLFPDDGELIARLIGTRAVSEPSTRP